jgi:hypothetical protein
VSVSVDGFIADREGAFGWTAPSEELFRFHLAQVRELGGYLLGSRLYETMLGMPAVASEFDRLLSSGVVGTKRVRELGHGRARAST